MKVKTKESLTNFKRSEIKDMNEISIHDKGRKERRTYQIFKIKRII